MSFQAIVLHTYENYNSTADTCKNFPKRGKGFKIGTNKAVTVQIENRCGGISKIFCFCLYVDMNASAKGISLKRKFLETFLLNFMNQV